ncbi:hypothetical protein [Polyangium sp. y55x31]|uniref:hypothetical protein n=1 Tax=Polyangium sp. y55x31 TaxID=3042688 RepID=UPI002482C227|nr:hypothetical protein [Polyangium sp. y55x31]MDI1475386.1 hypothetical protein [Polyangium sp. y55x31]
MRVKRSGNEKPSAAERTISMFAAQDMAPQFGARPHPGFGGGPLDLFAPKPAPRTTAAQVAIAKRATKRATRATTSSRPRVLGPGGRKAEGFGRQALRAALERCRTRLAAAVQPSASACACKAKHGKKRAG